MTPIGQDRETLTFKALLYLNVATGSHASLYTVLHGVYPIVQLGYLAIIFVVNQIHVFCYNKDPAI